MHRAFFAFFFFFASFLRGGHENWRLSWLTEIVTVDKTVNRSQWMQFTSLPHCFTGFLYSSMLVFQHRSSIFLCLQQLFTQSKIIALQPKIYHLIVHPVYLQSWTTSYKYFFLSCDLIINLNLTESNSNRRIEFGKKLDDVSTRDYQDLLVSPLFTFPFILFFVLHSTLWKGLASNT